MDCIAIQPQCIATLHRRWALEKALGAQAQAGRCDTAEGPAATRPRG